MSEEATLLPRSSHLDASGQSHVDDGGHVALVKSHAKGNGGHHHAHAVAVEQMLDLGALRGCLSGVIAHGRHAVGEQQLCDTVGLALSSPSQATWRERSKEGLTL